MAIKAISFDLDDTLLDEDYDKFIWYVALPKLYSQQKSVRFEDALRFVLDEYDSVPARGEWYNVSYWLDRFKLDADRKEFMMRYTHYIRTFPDAKPTLDALKGKYKLILTTNSSREFIEVKLEATGLAGYFDHVFSATTDFARSKTGANIFSRVAKLVKLKPEEILHIGDHKDFDYDKPKSVGMQTVLIDRSGKQTGHDVVHSLSELVKYLEKK